jgi:signal transduction histidine kinase
MTDGPARRAGPGRFLGAMRIRKKLIVVHTCFSLALALVLLAVLWPTITTMVARAESEKAIVLLRGILSEPSASNPDTPDPALASRLEVLSSLEHVKVNRGAAPDLGIDAAVARACIDAPMVAAPARLSSTRRAAAVAFVPSSRTPPGFFYAVELKIPEVREGVRRLYLLTTGALLAVYALIVIALEVLVLPRHVYEPIRRMLAADEAVRENLGEQELIPPATIPADELGEIMRSRNSTVQAMRRHQGELREALQQIETVATDLKRKNHLLETARRNLADADRLASLGVMSAGIAHELNTPLAVIKGLVEQMNAKPEVPLPKDQAALMLRVVRRLERLSESLLDFARARPSAAARVDLSLVVEDAATLVRLDRGAAGVRIVNEVPTGTFAKCDADRIVQVFVNLVRNGVDAVRERKLPAGVPPADDRVVDVSCMRSERDGREWISLSVRDTGPGIDPEILPRLFEPFATTRLDSRGTGLGLAVAFGIVREHEGVILARNRADRSGAIFEVMLPADVGDAAVEAVTESGAEAVQSE